MAKLKNKFILGWGHRTKFQTLAVGRVAQATVKVAQAICQGCTGYRVNSWKITCKISNKVEIPSWPRVLQYRVHTAFLPGEELIWEIFITFALFIHPCADNADAGG